VTDLALIFGAVLLAALGGEAFLKSILGAAIHLHVPKMVVATTLAAFATSSPELTLQS
jgi:cation:H+ antiporter